MKKIYLILACIIGLFSASYAFDIVGIRNAYGTYLIKLRKCSPYTFNVDGVATINRIVGMYNRRCVITSYTYTTATECHFTNEDLRKYIKVLPSLKAFSDNPEPIDLNTLKQAQKVKDDFATRGVCVSYGDDKKNNQ